MNVPFRQSPTRWTVAAYACIGVALSLVVLLSLWDAVRDLALMERTLLKAEIEGTRSHAQRTVGRVEQYLDATVPVTSLAELHEEPWLQQRFHEIIQQDARQGYAALTDANGKVLVHSDPNMAGRVMGRDWYRKRLGNVGRGVYLTDAEAIVDGRPAYDILIPILINGEKLGEYHSGFSVDWFERSLAEERSSLLRRRLLLSASIFGIVLLATVSLYFIAVRSERLNRAVADSEIRRARELEQLAAGLAHEIRNPLHTIRLNLHMHVKAHRQRDSISPDELEAMLAESNREIDRLDRLLQQLSEFAKPLTAAQESFDARQEIRSTLEFVRSELGSVEITTRLGDRPARVQMDRDRFRQVALNLIFNAREAVDGNGHIEIEVARKGGWVELTVADDGAGLQHDQFERFFDPFYSTKSHGSGLGLALVKRFVEEARGRVDCEENHPHGARFAVKLPAGPAPSKRS